MKQAKRRAKDEKRALRKAEKSGDLVDSGEPVDTVDSGESGESGAASDAVATEELPKMKSAV
jgi:hypothetical protein